MKIWIDLENSPHVPFFVPIVRELEERGIGVVITARDFAQTKDLVEQAGLNVRFVGKEAGSQKLRKAVAIASRAFGLVNVVRGNGVGLAVGHGSRGQLIAAKLLRIPSLTLYDYEGASVSMLNRLATKVMTPEIIPFERLSKRGLTRDKHLTYPGLKEEVYLAGFLPDRAFAAMLGLDPAKIIVTVRPPSDTAHYRSEESRTLFDEIMRRLVRRNDVQIVLSPRTNDQSLGIQAADWFNAAKIVMLSTAVDGANLLYHSDLVIGGGGTMNREAAVLGVPVLSIFKGESGAVDEWLISEGKMILLSDPDIERYIKPRDRTALAVPGALTKKRILRAILEMLAEHRKQA